MITSGPVVSCFIYAQSLEAFSGSLFTDRCTRARDMGDFKVMLPFETLLLMYEFCAKKRRVQVILRMICTFTDTNYSEL